MTHLLAQGIKYNENALTAAAEERGFLGQVTAPRVFRAVTFYFYTVWSYSFETLPHLSHTSLATVCHFKSPVLAFGQSFCCEQDAATASRLAGTRRRIAETQSDQCLSRVNACRRSQPLVCRGQR